MNARTQSIPGISKLSKQRARLLPFKNFRGAGLLLVGVNDAIGSVVGGSKKKKSMTLSMSVGELVPHLLCQWGVIVPHCWSQWGEIVSQEPKKACKKATSGLKFGDP